MNYMKHFIARLKKLPSQIRAIGEFSYLSGEILRTLRKA
jgi:hypothetical protein